ncbi:hypothetical protein ACNO5E_25150 [Vibrio parahaemolyticus]
MGTAFWGKTGQSAAVWELHIEGETDQSAALWELHFGAKQAKVQLYGNCTLGQNRPKCSYMGTAHWVKTGQSAAIWELHIGVKQDKVHIGDKPICSIREQYIAKSVFFTRPI